MKTEPYSPLPWILNGNAAYSDGCKDRGSVFECRLATGTHVPAEQNNINAAYIVQAVNNHDSIVKALAMFVGSHAIVLGREIRGNGTGFPPATPLCSCDLCRGGRAALEQVTE